MEKFEQQNEQEKWGALADTILELDPPQNGGGGETVTESIASALRRGDINRARACCFSESDKFSSREKVKNILIAELFDGKDHPWFITNPWNTEDAKQ